MSRRRWARRRPPASYPPGGPDGRARRGCPPPAARRAACAPRSCDGRRRPRRRAPGARASSGRSGGACAPGQTRAPRSGASRYWRAVSVRIGELSFIPQNSSASGVSSSRGLDYAIEHSGDPAADRSSGLPHPRRFRGSEAAHLVMGNAVSLGRRRFPACCCPAPRPSGDRVAPPPGTSRRPASRHEEPQRQAGEAGAESEQEAGDKGAWRIRPEDGCRRSQIADAVEEAPDPGTASGSFGERTRKRPPYRTAASSNDRTGRPHRRNEGAKFLKCGGRSDRGVNMTSRLTIVNIRQPSNRRRWPVFGRDELGRVRDRTRPTACRALPSSFDRRALVFETTRSSACKSSGAATVLARPEANGGLAARREPPGRGIGGRGSPDTGATAWRRPLGGAPGSAKRRSMIPRFNPVFADLPETSSRRCRGSPESSGRSISARAFPTARGRTTCARRPPAPSTRSATSTRR